MKKLVRALLAIVVFGLGAPLLLGFWGYTVAGKIGEESQAKGTRLGGSALWQFLAAVVVYLAVAAVTWFGIYSAVVTLL